LGANDADPIDDSSSAAAIRLDVLRRALQARAPVRDEDFDCVYPLRYRQISAQYWTPVEAARRAAALLAGEDVRRVLDVGAGVGKFCVVAAASVPRATFTGVEHRRHLVDAGRRAVRILRIPRVELLHARLSQIAAGDFDAFYFYNPFAENLLGQSLRIDDSVPLSLARFDADVRRSHALLATAPPGTRVVTYYGYGGQMPAGYDLVHADRGHVGLLQLWVRTCSACALTGALAS
jgi:hypothetical protein